MRDMRVERPPAPFGPNAEIAARLRRLDHAEARLAAANGKVEVRLGGDLQEDTGVRPALIGLSGRMLAVAIASNAPIGSRFPLTPAAGPAVYARAKISLGSRTPRK
jgi:hypothetical protein